MESEKVKEIKEALEFQRDSLVYLKDNIVEYISCKDILTYINELESENERLRLERDVLIGKKIVEKQKHDKAIIMKIDIQKQLINRIAELEKENETKTDTIANLLKNQEFYETEKLKQFAERLKKRAILYSGINVKYEAITGDIIDELLKEYEEWENIRDWQKKADIQKNST